MVAVTWTRGSPGIRHTPPAGMTAGHLRRKGLSVPASRGRTAWVGEDTPSDRFADMPHTAVPAASFLHVVAADAADMPCPVARAVVPVAALPEPAEAVHIRIDFRIPDPDFRMAAAPVVRLPPGNIEDFAAPPAVAE